MFKELLNFFSTLLQQNLLMAANQKSAPILLRLCLGKRGKRTLCVRVCVLCIRVCVCVSVCECVSLCVRERIKKYVQIYKIDKYTCSTKFFSLWIQFRVFFFKCKIEKCSFESQKHVNSIL